MLTVLKEKYILTIFLKHSIELLGLPTLYATAYCKTTFFSYGWYNSWHFNIDLVFRKKTNNIIALRSIK